MTLGVLVRVLVLMDHDCWRLDGLLQRRYVFDFSDTLILDLWLNLMMVTVVSHTRCRQWLLLQETGQTLFGVLILIEFSLTAHFYLVLRCLITWNLLDIIVLAGGLPERGVVPTVRVVCKVYHRLSVPLILLLMMPSTSLPLLAHIHF